MQVVPFAEWTAHQILAVKSILLAHRDRWADHPLVSPDSHELVWERLINGTVRGALVGGYVLIYDVGPTWCCRQDILHEFMVARVESTASFTDYVAGLRYIAAVNNCIGITTGNGVLRPGLRKLYERAGFEKQNEAYFLGVQHGRIG